MARKNDKAGKEQRVEKLGKMIDVYRSGFNIGTQECFDWCASCVEQLQAQAQTSHGKVALERAGELISAEKKRRYPDEE